MVDKKEAKKNPDRLIRIEIILRSDLFASWFVFDLRSFKINFSSFFIDVIFTVFSVDINI